jgi:hypothetical protein
MDCDNYEKSTVITMKFVYNEDFIKLILNGITKSSDIYCSTINLLKRATRFMRIFSIVFIVLVLSLNSCFGPFNPYDPPPSQTDDDTTSTTQNGLIAYWKCNDTGKTLTDELGLYNGIISGPTFESGIDSTALQFNGSSDYIYFDPADDSVFNFGTGDFTVSLWVKPVITKLVTDSTRYIILAKGIALESGFTLAITGDQNANPRFSGYVGNYQAAETNDTTFNAADATWRHIVLLRRSATVELYVDGIEINSYPYSMTITTELHFLIGDDASSREDNEFPGSIDEIKISDIAWTTTKINYEYNLHKQ